MDHINNCNFESLRLLCKKHIDEIKERKNLEYVLSKKQVRYIDPEGHFGYTTFGNFYFDTMGVMMLITKEHPLTWYHRPDEMRDTLWSTVPVIYAGIETGVADDRYRHIFTGDIVNAKEHPDCIAMVAWPEWTKYPSLVLDNCALPLDHKQPLEVVGNIFFDIETSQYDTFNIDRFLRHNPIFQGPVEKDRIEEIMEKIKTAPSFLDGKPKSVKKYPMVYDLKVSKPKIGPNDIVVAFCEDIECQAGEAPEETDLYIDCGLLTEDYENRCETIPINTGNPDWDKIEKKIDDLLLKIHCNPDTRYVLCEFQDSIFVPPFLNEISRIFKKAADYQIRNLVMPLRMAMWE